jgi:hypothetical protein
MSKTLNTPVLLIGFNRPGLTKKVLKQISLVRPRELYFAVDGPRSSSDLRDVQAVKEVIKSVDWPCKVRTNFSRENMGCMRGPVRAINWFFSHVDRGIILEDDVLPGKSFFWYCEELLERYKKNNRVGMISGNNFTPIHDRYNSYMFTNYTQTWGWATWKRAWCKFNLDIRNWPENKHNKWLESRLDNFWGRCYWFLVFNDIYKKYLNTVWDYQWTYTCWDNQYLNVVPNINLASNIGINVPGATHTVLNNKLVQYPVKEITFPLKHPHYIISNNEFDYYIQKNNYILWKEILAGLLRRLKIINSKILG